MIVTGINTAVFGLAGGLLGSISLLIALRGISRIPRNRSQAINRDTWREVLRYIAPMSPGIFVFMIQDPLVYWLALTFGGQAPLSEAFALGRIGAIYALLGNFTVAVVVPKLARINNDAEFAKFAGLFLFALVVLCTGVLMMAQFTPSILLLLIGPKYAHLETEVVLSIGAASVGVLVGFLVIANRLRGWVRLDPAIAICQTVAIFVLATHWSFQDSASVLRLTLVLAGVSCFGAFITSFFGLVAPKVVQIR
jgi:hypothetical protein